MTWKKLRAAALGLIAELPPMPRPWSVDELCRRVAARRGRPMLLHALTIPALPFGLWYDDGHCDHIIYRAGIANYHRDHVILHEMCHMLARHNIVGRPPPGDDVLGDDSPVGRLIERARRSSHTDLQEGMAELFASKVLSLVMETPVAELSVFERRAAALFGAG